MMVRLLAVSERSEILEEIRNTIQQLPDANKIEIFEENSGLLVLQHLTRGESLFHFLLLDEKMMENRELFDLLDKIKTGCAKCIPLLIQDEIRELPNDFADVICIPLAQMKKLLRWIVCNGIKILGEEPFSRQDINEQIRRIAFLISCGEDGRAALLGLGRETAKSIYRYTPELFIDRLTFAAKSLELLLAYLNEKTPCLKSYVNFELLWRVEEDDCFSEEVFCTFFIERIMEIYCCHEKLRLTTQNVLVQDIHNYLLENVEWNRLGLSDVADVFNISPYYLSHIFRHETGSTFIQHVTFLKMERAKFLLQNSTLKINEIARCLEYEDAEYFSRVFKKEVGLNASSFRKKNRKWNYEANNSYDEDITGSMP